MPCSESCHSFHRDEEFLNCCSYSLVCQHKVTPVLVALMRWSVHCSGSEAELWVAELSCWEGNHLWRGGKADSWGQYRFQQCCLHPLLSMSACQMQQSSEKASLLTDQLHTIGSNVTVSLLCRWNQLIGESISFIGCRDWINKGSVGWFGVPLFL